MHVGSTVVKERASRIGNQTNATVFLLLPHSDFDFIIDGVKYVLASSNSEKQMRYEWQMDGPLDKLIHRKQMEIAVENEEQLNALRANYTTTLSLRTVCDPIYHEEICHCLVPNTSVTGLLFHTNPTRIEYDGRPMQEADWLRLLVALRCKQDNIQRLKFGGSEIPFYTIPTMLWQFRRLTHLQLACIDGFQWTAQHWQVMSTALCGIPQLVSLTMTWSPGNMRHHASNDVLVAALATTAPSLKEYIQNCQCLDSTRVSRRVPTQPMLSIAALAALIRSTSLEKLEYSRVPFHSLAEASTVQESMKCTSLIEISLPYTHIDGKSACFILQGIMVSRTLWNSNTYSIEICRISH